jgi:ribosome-binding factor A
MKHRMLRVNEVVKRELSGVIAREIAFEGALVSINHVDVSSDLKSAHVFVSVLGSESGEKVMNKLEEHRPALQSELARRVTMKFTPHLLFHLDESIARGSRVVEILQQIDADSEKNE